MSSTLLFKGFFKFKQKLILRLLHPLVGLRISDIIQIKITVIHRKE